MPPPPETWAGGPSARLGAQIWLERSTPTWKIEELVAAAADSGLGLVRIFLVWGWIETDHGLWDFGMYDALFDAAARRGIKVKATLTPEGTPWHVGTPGFVQSAPAALPSSGIVRERIRAYVHACVLRYRDHPALAQWILWNEPMYPAVPPPGPDPRRSKAQRRVWTSLLRRRFADRLDALNRRWHTGYRTFDEVPFPEEIAHEAHRGGPFFSFDPWLADLVLRAESLSAELSWVSGVIRELDPTSPTCVNPPDLFSNHAATGHDFESLAHSVDVLGASVHAPWHLGFADHSAHPGLVAVATGLLRTVPGDHRTELTEVQFGNVWYGSPHPLPVEPADVAASALAALFAGAETVTGWALNARNSDFEAGDWGLLDDDDRPGDRSAALRRVAAVVDELDRRIGPWQPLPATALALFSGASEAVDLVHSWTGAAVPGRNPDEPAQGAGLLALELLRLGVPAAPAPVSALDDSTADVLVCSHLSAYDEITGRQLLQRVENGTTLVLDASTGRKRTDGATARPWPGELADELGIRTRGLRTRPDGHPVDLDGAPCGRLPLVVADYDLDPAWSADPRARLTDDGLPLLWRRRYGAGQILLVAGQLGSGLVTDPQTAPLARYVLAEAIGRHPAIRPISENTILLSVSTDDESTARTAHAVISPPVRRREGRPMTLAVPPSTGPLRDLWSGRRITPDANGTVRLDSPDGIAILITEP